MCVCVGEANRLMSYTSSVDNKVRGNREPSRSGKEFGRLLEVCPSQASQTGQSKELTPAG